MAVVISLTLITPVMALSKGSKGGGSGGGPVTQEKVLGIPTLTKR
jgi:hypothetical protein